MNLKKKIFIIDSDITNLLICKETLSEHYDVLTIASGEKLLSVLQEIHPDLILLAANLPEITGIEVLRRLKSKRSTEKVPIILLTAWDDFEQQRLGLEYGVVDFLVKPIEKKLLLRLVEQHLLIITQQEEIESFEKKANQLAEEKRASIRNLQDITLDTISAVFSRNNNIVTMPKAAALRDCVLVMLEEMRRKGLYHHEIAEWDIDSFINAAQLHDIGKFIIRDNIIKKPGKLTAEEFEAIKKHPMFGVRVIELMKGNEENLRFFDYAKQFAATHHERWDGSGYPYGLKEQEIPIEGRILSIVDVYNALVSERPYKEPISHEEARDVILKGSTMQFDPDLIEIFNSVADSFADIYKKS